MHSKKIFLVNMLSVFAVTVSVMADEARPLRISSGNRTLDVVDGQRVEMSGRSLLILTGLDPLVNGGELRLNSEDAWVLFQRVRPSIVQERSLSQIRIHGEPAVPGRNLRIAQFGPGAMIIPHGPGYPALQTFDEPNLRGKASEHVILKYDRAAELGPHNDRISSFVLKKGYMATLAENEDGSGASQVFIARDQDVRTLRLPPQLRGKVSFLRVFPWRWTGKKGIDGSDQTAALLNCQWRYSWDAGGESSLDIEYVPMKHKRYWDSWENIERQTTATHLLGFNEPMQPDQANMSLEDCLAEWPRLQASGLRLGSPSTTDGTVDWLYRFLAEANKRGYRVDFVAVHFYKGGWSAQQLVQWLQEIHQRTGRPIWVTEFNNGAPWVQGHHPSREETARQIGEFIQAMDQCPFVERYAVFGMDGPRAILENGQLTPAGVVYRDHPPVEAFVSSTSRQRPRTDDAMRLFTWQRTVTPFVAGP